MSKTEWRCTQKVLLKKIMKEFVVNQAAAPPDGVGILGEARERVRTCRHFRYLIPTEDADELRAADPEPCEVCDQLAQRKRIYLEVWNPKPPRGSVWPPGLSQSHLVLAVRRVFESCRKAEAVALLRAIRALF